MVRRKKHIDIWNHIPKKEFTILIGARQIGKSTLLKQLFADLGQKGEIVYFLNLDRKDILDDLNENPENLFAICPLKEDKKIIVFIDEIQYLNDATSFLKFLFDEYSDRLKIVATGSSAFYIDKQFNDSLVGRKKIFQMGTLDFEEFLLFKSREDLVLELNQLRSRKKTKSIQENLLWTYMDEFMNYGGYPAIVLENNIEEKIEMLKEIRDSYINQHIPQTQIINIHFWHFGQFFSDIVVKRANQGNMKAFLQNIQIIFNSCISYF